MTQVHSQHAAPALTDPFDLVVEDRGSAPVFPLPADWTSEEHLVGDLTVTVVSPRPGSDAARHANGLPILTFHDIGLSGPTCFASFFSYACSAGNCPEVYSAAAHFHVTAPGHAPDAPLLPSSFPELSFVGLGERVIAVLDHFHLSRVIGLGVGAGASVLVHAALDDHRKRFGGLVLVSPLFYASGYAERAYAAMDGTILRGLGLGRRVKDRFLHRWLSPNTQAENHDLVAVLDDSLDRLNASNVVRYMSAETWRDDLTARLSELQAKVLLVTGRESPLRFHSADCFSSLDPRETSWIDVTNAGSLTLEETPDKVASGISLFLQGFGIYEHPSTGAASMYK